MLVDDFFLGTELYHKQFAALCKPLVDYLGVTDAMYVNVDKHGRMFNTCTHQKWLEQFTGQEYYKFDPLMVSPKNIHSGFAFDSASDDQIFQSTIQIDAVFNFGFHHSCIYVEKVPNDNSYFGFAFATVKDNCQMINRLVNEAAIVKKIIRSINKNLISVIKDLNEMRIDLPALKGEAFYTQRGEIFHEDYADSQQKKIALLRDAGLLTDLSSQEEFFAKCLSPQEMNCLRIYLGAHNLKAVARETGLSVSTVKSYIENTKEKLSCHTRHELFEKAAILESLGCL